MNKMNKNEREIFAGIKFQTIILKSGTGKINFERGKADEYTEKKSVIDFFLCNFVLYAENCSIHSFPLSLWQVEPRKKAWKATGGNNL